MESADENGSDDASPVEETFFDTVAEAMERLGDDSVPFDDRLHHLLVKTLASLGAERGSIMLLEGEELVVRAATDRELIGERRTIYDNSVSATALRERRGLLIGKIGEEPAPVDFYTDGRYKTATLLTLPILFSGEPLGVINVTDKVSRRAFRKRDETMLSLFAGMALAALVGREAKEQRDELAAANEELRRLQGFRDQLTSMIVHDLKGPTGEIIANLNMLGDLPSDDFERELLENSVAAGESLLRMIMNILDIGKMDAGRFSLNRSRVEMTPLIREATRRLATMAAHEEKVVNVDLPETPLPALVDRQVVERVLWNLLSNANNHTNPEETITVTLKGDDRSVSFSVADSGAGIDEADLPHLFDRYYQGKEAGRYNVGLGLAFCKLAIDAHGGSIDVESVRGEGATFTVTLPVEPVT